MLTSYTIFELQLNIKTSHSPTVWPPKSRPLKLNISVDLFVNMVLQTWKVLDFLITKVGITHAFSNETSYFWVNNMNLVQKT